jgi:hypothetical protein
MKCREEFLSGTFIHKITNSDELMKKLIETNLKLGKKLKDKNIIIRFKFPRLKVNISSLYINPLYFFQYL